MLLLVKTVMNTPQDFNDQGVVSVDLVINTLDIDVNKAKINLDQKQVFIDIKLRLAALLPINNKEEDSDSQDDTLENSDESEDCDN